MSTFEPFPKISRLARGVVITEKLDGTNAQVFITPATANATADPSVGDKCIAMVGELALYAGSRTRWITPGKLTDNFGFAQWVQDNADELAKLGEGRHFGEWYGKGIQRGYGLEEKRFALFNTHCWNVNHPPPACCSVVPVVAAGHWDCVEGAMEQLGALGSVAVPGFMKPEGVVVFHPASGTVFKKTFDDNHKEAVAA